MCGLNVTLTVPLKACCLIYYILVLVCCVYSDCSEIQLHICEYKRLWCSLAFSFIITFIIN